MEKDKSYPYSDMAGTAGNLAASPFSGILGRLPMYSGMLGLVVIFVIVSIILLTGG